MRQQLLWRRQQEIGKEEEKKHWLLSPGLSSFSFNSLGKSQDEKLREIRKSLFFLSFSSFLWFVLLSSASVYFLPFWVLVSPSRSSNRRIDKTLLFIIYQEAARQGKERHHSAFGTLSSSCDVMWCDVKYTLGWLTIPQCCLVDIIKSSIQQEELFLFPSFLHSPMRGRKKG